MQSVKLYTMTIGQLLIGYFTHGKFLMLSFLILMNVFDLAGASIKWNGGSGDWSKSTNWIPAQIPQAGDTVIINVPGILVTLDVNSADINSLTLDQDAQLLINVGTQLTITGVNNRAIHVVNGGITNDGRIVISSFKGVAIVVEGMGSVTNFGVIDINDVLGNHSLENHGSIENHGRVHIVKSDQEGIINYGQIENTDYLSIDQTGNDGIINQGVIVNQDSMILTDLGTNGVTNYDSIYNDSDAVLQILNSEENGLHNAGSQSAVHSEGVVYIRDFELIGVWNQGTMVSNSRTIIQGSANNGPNFAFLNNSGYLEIGLMGSVFGTNLTIGEYVVNDGILVCYGRMEMICD